MLRMLMVTEENFNKISRDYRGEWTESVINYRGDVSKKWIGRKTVLEGCLTGKASSRLLTEGIHFKIV